MNIGRAAFVVILLAAVSCMALVFVLAANTYLLVSDAPPQPRLIAVPTPAVYKTTGCGSRGGPGVRLANGKCASWDELGQTPRPRKR